MTKVVKTIKTVKLDSDDDVYAALLMAVSKLSTQHPDEALKILSMCTNNDIPKISVLVYTLDLIEDNQDSLN